jgi:hypothetical protein
MNAISKMIVSLKVERPHENAAIFEGNCKVACRNLGYESNPLYYCSNVTKAKTLALMQ